MLKLILSILSVGNFALADSPYEPDLSPIITKVNQTGYMLPEYRKRETCEVFLQRVVVTTEMGQSGTNKPVIMKRSYKANFSPNIHQLIANASKDEFQVSNIQVCDAPTTVIEAQAPNVKKFPLFRSGSCNQARAERIGGASHQLRSIVDSFCPETHDPGGPGLHR